MVLCDLWWPLALGQKLASRAGRSVPIPFDVWCCWHVANARTLATSRTATDPFPSEALA